MIGLQPWTVVPPRPASGTNGVARVTVVVPTYRRPMSLDACLRALERQRVAPEAVLVVVRPDDEETHTYFEQARLELPLQIVQTDRPGQVQALNAGLARVTTPIVAFTDDDAQPRPQWIERMVDWFASDAGLGAVGGRDIITAPLIGDPDEGDVSIVGRILPFGRMIGQHQYRAPAQRVHFLKGANMGFRTEALMGFDERLRGAGAQVHNDLKASLEVLSRGYGLIWDPDVAVDHAPAPRYDADDRSQKSLQALADRCHNEAYAFLAGAPPRHGVVAFAYGVLVGSRAAPGLLFWALAAIRRDPTRFTRAGKALTGRLQGAATAAGARDRNRCI
jgi:glycosyltransferase involved in cell wall biosynthesis